MPAGIAGVPSGTLAAERASPPADGSCPAIRARRRAHVRGSSARQPPGRRPIRRNCRVGAAGARGPAINRLVDTNTELAGEIARLRTTTAVRAGNTAAVERRVGNVERLLERYLFAEPAARPGDVRDDDTPPDEDAGEDDESLTLVDVLRQAAASYPDALLILETAERAAERSPYEDPERAAVVLDAMAHVARRRQEGVLGMSLREAFRELGVDYRGGIAASTSKRQRQQ